MQWSEFQPYVLPYVIGCPDPVLEHHARLSSIEFCRRTLCLTQALATVVADGTSHEFALPAGTGLQIIKVKSLTVDGLTWQLVPTIQGQELVASGSMQDFAFVTADGDLSVYPLQPAGVEIVVTAAVAPTMTAVSCPDGLISYLQDIAHGVSASVMMIPAQVFTNPAHSQQEYAVFNTRIATVAAKVARGMSSAKMRTRSTFL